MTALIIIFGILLLISILSTFTVIEIPSGKLTGLIGMAITTFIIFNLAKTELLENFVFLFCSIISLIIYLIILFKNRKRN